MNRLLHAALFVVLVGCIHGCGSKTTTPATATVKGSVTLDGKAMGGGEIRFSLQGQPAKAIPINNGSFSGEAYVGKNHVEVVWDKDGPPNPMNPSERIKVNAVGQAYWGPNSKLSADVAAGGTSDLKFAVGSR